MKQNQIRVIVNIAVSCIFILPVILFIVPLVVLGNNPEFMNWIIITIFAFVIFGITAFTSMKLLIAKKPNKKISYINQVLTYLMICVLIFFPGYFFTNKIWFVALVFGIITLISYIHWQSNKKLTLSLTLITFSISFKENYCWDYANKSPNNTKLYPIQTVEESRFLGTYDPNASISGWLRVHLKCDKEVTFWQAVKKTLQL